MVEKKRAANALWLSIPLSVVSLIMSAEYARLVLSGHVPPRRVVALVVWILIAVVSVTVSVVRYRGRRGKGGQDELEPSAPLDPPRRR